MTNCMKLESRQLIINFKFVEQKLIEHKTHPVHLHFHAETMDMHGQARMLILDNIKCIFT